MKRGTDRGRSRLWDLIAMVKDEREEIVIGIWGSAGNGAARTMDESSDKQ